MKHVLAITCFFMTVNCALAEQAERPNFIIIFCDDLGYGDLPCYGSNWNQTPEIDQMAEEGMRFTSFYAGAPVCTPSRASLLTGCYARRVDLDLDSDGNPVFFPVEKKGLNSRETILPEALQSVGYQTAIVGKWHLGDQPEHLPINHGFDYWFGLPYSNDMEWAPRGDPPLPLMKNDQIIQQYPRHREFDQTTLTQRYTEEAIAWLDLHKDQPFFLYLAHTMPHVPIAARQKFFEKTTNPKAVFGASVAEISWSTGQILDWLAANELDENTLVLFTSDNGGNPTHGAHNGPLRGYKAQCYEGGIRVPCIARWPGVIPSESTCSQLASVVDVFPTLTSLAGYEEHDEETRDGQDISDYFGEPDRTTEPRDFYYWYSGRLEAVRHGDWKLLFAGEFARRTQKKVELYDLQSDPGETVDVSADRPEIVERLLQLADEHREQLGELDQYGPEVRSAAEVGSAVPLTLDGKGLQPYLENPRYWSVDGKPVLLLGGSDDDNLFQWPAAELIPHLNRMQGAGANIVRNTMSDRKIKGSEIYAYRQGADGKYDLRKWNDQYWNRFELFLSETCKRNIVVQIEVWDRFDYTDSRGDEYWQSHPYNPRNNVNYSYGESGFEKRYPDHPAQNRQPFFFTTPRQHNNELILGFQERFVHRMLDAALPYDHVLYCIDNETRADPEWGLYWADLIKRRAKQAGKTVFVTEMWDDWNLKAELHRNTFDHPGVYGFVDVSQNNHNTGQKHWDNFLYVRDYLSQVPRPINTIKTYGADGNKFGHSDRDAIERFWRHLLGGAASIRFHRPPAGLGLSDRACASIRAARLLETKVCLWNLKPAQHLLSNRDENEAYLAADQSSACIVYFPDGGQVTLDLSAFAEPVEMQWIDIDSGSWLEREAIAAGKNTVVITPKNGNVAAILTHIGD